MADGTSGPTTVDVSGEGFSVKDIESLQAECRLIRDELEQERKLFVDGPVVLFKWSNQPGWPVQFVSGNVSGLLGYTQDDFMSGRARYSGLIHPGDFSRLQDDVERMVAGQADRYTHEPYRLRRRDESIIWVLDHTVVVRDANGEATEFIGYVMDITGRVEAESALRESEERWHFALDGARDGVWDWDAVTNKVFFSRRWKSMLGYAEHEIGDDLSEWDSRIHPDDKDQVYKDLNRHMRGESEYYENIHRIRCKDGSYKWILDRGRVLSRDAEGNPLRAIGTHTDMSERVEGERKLKESRRRLAEAQRLARMGNWEWIVGTGEIHWSDEVFRIFEVDPEAFALDFEHYAELIHPEDRDEVLWRIDAALAKGGDYIVEHRIMAGGRVKHVQSLGVAELDGDGNPLRMAGTVQDVTDKVLKETALREREAMLRAMSEASHDAMIMIDSSDTILFWNVAAENLFGYTRDEAMGKKMHDLIALPEDAAKAHKGLEHFAGTGTGPVMDSVMEFTAVKKSGEAFPVERSVSAFQAGDQWFAVGSLRDITRRKKDEAKLTELANIDGLTGLNNRRNFMDVAGLQFRQSKRYGKPFSVVMFDVDHFKRVNDTYGHDIGDEVLKAISRSVEATCRDADVPGRLGGEEFAVALPETGLAEALQAAERIRAALAACRVGTPKGEIAFTVSLGVAAAGDGHGDLETLLKEADTALYKAKQGGRNRVEAAG